MGGWVGGRVGVLQGVLFGLRGVCWFVEQAAAS